MLASNEQTAQFVMAAQQGKLKEPAAPGLQKKPTLTKNKMQNLENLMYSSLRGNGFNRAPYNGLCLEEPLLSL